MFDIVTAEPNRRTAECYDKLVNGARDRRDSESIVGTHPYIKIPLHIQVPLYIGALVYAGTLVCRSAIIYGYNYIRATQYIYIYVYNGTLI